MIFNHIILADDDVDDALLLQEAIRHHSPHVKISTFEHGKDLIEYIHKEDVPDVLVIDLNMPKMNGKDLIVALRCIEKVKHVPIAVFSTSNNRVEVESCFKLGANYYIVKPSTFSEMIQFGKQIVTGKIQSSF